MLHRGSSLYKSVRNDDLLKVKTHDDAEAKVIAYIPGKGKNSGQLGALLVDRPAKDGQSAKCFELGIGLRDVQWQNPAAVGSQDTYRHRGLNDSGTPRFASFFAAACGLAGRKLCYLFKSFLRSYSLGYRHYL